MSGPGRDEAATAFGRFDVLGPLVSLEPHPVGLINHSWVAVAAPPGATRRFLLQRINRHVFHRPDQVMENIARVNRHVARSLVRDGIADASRRVLDLVPTRDGAAFHVDSAGETWRLLPWIEGTRSPLRASTAAEARETARAFGRFVRQLSDLPGPPLFETIPGFHDTQGRLAAFEQAVAADRASRAEECRNEIAALLDRRGLASALAAPAARGEIPVRPTHNDAKIANVLFDEETGEALCVVDLDTVMPGLALHDFGDLARSTVSDSDEDERDLSRIAVRADVFAALAEGFAEGSGDALCAAERALLVTGTEVIVYEQTLRFLGDYLDGDRYYRIARPRHNLERTRAQLRLLESLEEASAELHGIAGGVASPGGAGR